MADRVSKVWACCVGFSENVRKSSSQKGKVESGKWKRWERRGGTGWCSVVIVMANGVVKRVRRKWDPLMSALINMRRSVVGVGTHLRSEWVSDWGHCNYVHWEDLRLGTCWRKICLTGLLFLFLFFIFFQENNKICLTATGGAFYFCFFFFKKITRYASLPLVGPFFLFFFKKI